MILAASIGALLHLLFSTSKGSLTGNIQANVRGTSLAVTDAVNAQCQFFLAESAIPMAGLGVFTAINIKKNHPVQNTPDICVYITDANNQTEVDTHTWQDHRFGAQWEAKNPRAACEGVVVQFNSMNMKKFASARPTAIQELIHTNAGLRRDKSPGAGAITHYFGASSVALRDLEPGTELMLWDDSHDVHEDHAIAPLRTPEWLQQHGLCIDHMRVKMATDPQMGRGAFATRRLPKGTVVAPAPLQIFKDRSEFAKQTPEQLFVNYCFQPKGSKMLLFPYGQGFGLINHSGKHPNVKLRWSTHHMNHKRWLDLPLDQFWVMQHPGSMIVEVVAIRDIEQDEEIFMDYGKDWEEAWNRHVQNWKPADVAKDYVYPEDMDLTEPFRTIKEQKENPYPKNLMLVCDTANYYREANTTMKWQPSKRWPEDLVDCQILSRKQNSDKSYFFNVSLWLKSKSTYIDYDVPQSAISFVDRPYMSDQDLASAFRHPIGFPEAMTPPQWLDDVNKE